jgi:hypothetical protein
LNGNSNVLNSWVPGNDPALFGLSTGSWSGFYISEKFGQSAISVSLQCEHVAVIPATPGPWYNSGLLHLALASQSVPPWSSAAGWNTYFGLDGILNFAIGSVIAVDGLSLNLTSDAGFNSEEQAMIESQVVMGYWPLYCSEASLAISNDISFNGGKMTITCRSATGTPVLIGNNVFAIKKYLGG